MAQLKLTEIIEQLVKFFSNKAPKHATIDSRTNVRQLLGLHAYEWRALAEEINGLSRLRKAQLKITQTAMLQMNTIGEIAKALVASRKREGLKVHSSREQGKKRTSLVTPKRGTLPTAPEGGARRPSVTPSSDRVSARPKGTEVDADYTVWFGTNRKPVDPEKIELGFSASRDTKIHHGFCRVFIPHSHKIGSTGSSWWERYWTGMDDRLKFYKSMNWCLPAIGKPSQLHWQQSNLTSEMGSFSSMVTMSHSTTQRRAPLRLVSTSRSKAPWPSSAGRHGARLKVTSRMKPQSS